MKEPASCSAAACMVAAERSIAARIVVAVLRRVAPERNIAALAVESIRAADLVEPGVANIAVDIGAADLPGRGALSAAARPEADIAVAHNRLVAALAHPVARSGSVTVWRLGRRSSQSTAAARSHAQQTRPRALQLLRRRSVSERSIYSVRETCERLLGEEFDSVRGNAVLRTKHADSFRDSCSLSVHSEPLKLPSSGPSETNGAETNGDRTARGEGLIQRPGPQQLVSSLGGIDLEVMREDVTRIRRGETGLARLGRLAG